MNWRSIPEFCKLAAYDSHIFQRDEFISGMGVSFQWVGGDKAQVAPGVTWAGLIMLWYSYNLSLATNVQYQLVARLTSSASLPPKKPKNLREIKILR